MLPRQAYNVFAIPCKCAESVSFRICVCGDVLRDLQPCLEEVSSIEMATRDHGQQRSTFLLADRWSLTLSLT